jgi:hypothetical protein
MLLQVIKLQVGCKTKMPILASQIRFVSWENESDRFIQGFYAGGRVVGCGDSLPAVVWEAPLWGGTHPGAYPEGGHHAQRPPCHLPSQACRVAGMQGFHC